MHQIVNIILHTNGSSHHECTQNPIELQRRDSQLLSAAQGNTRSGMGYHRHFKLSISLPSLLDVFILFRCHLLSFSVPTKTTPTVATMILDQIAWSDCFVFLIFLAPQLVLRVGFINTVACILKALPHLRRSQDTEERHICGC